MAPFPVSQGWSLNTHTGHSTFFPPKNHADTPAAAAATADARSGYPSLLFISLLTMQTQIRRWPGAAVFRFAIHLLPMAQ